MGRLICWGTCWFYSPKQFFFGVYIFDQTIGGGGIHSQAICMLRIYTCQNRVPIGLESQRKPGKIKWSWLRENQGKSCNFSVSSKSQGKSRNLFFKCWLSWNDKILWLSSEQWKILQLPFHIKLLTKFWMWPAKFVSGSRKRIGNCFSDFWWEPCRCSA